MAGLIQHVLGLLLALGICRAGLPDGCSWRSASLLDWGLSDCKVELNANATEGLAKRASREPGEWLPLELRPAQKDQGLALINVTIALPACSTLWELHVLECSLSISATWPSPGLQAGPGYLYYRRLPGVRSTARRVNITCPTQDWLALLAARVEARSDSGTAPLGPCGTAIVTTGTQLLEAMRELQLSNTRVLITLDASMALPAQPTPQRCDATPDDATPLLRIYRNLTLAGGLLQSRGAQFTAGDTVTQLNLRLHRNAFRVEEQPAAGQSRHVFVTADLRLVNGAYGPPSTWPLGLLGILPYDVAVDRSGAGLQTVGLRVQRVLASGASEYLNYWYRRMYVPDSVERSNAMWVQQLDLPMQQATDDAGWNVSVARVADYGLNYNSSFVAPPLLESVTQPDFDLWSDLPPQLPGGAQPALLPPSSFATATSGVQLLALLQEAWVGGPRAILLPTNITLQPGEWPQVGAALSYNVMLVGPVAGQPVWLHASGLQLARPAAAATGARPVRLQLLRLRLAGWSPALVGPAVGEAGPLILSALDTSPGLRQWRDRCWGSISTAPTASDSILVLRYELYGCALEFRQESLDALRYYAAALQAPCAASANTSVPAVGCGLQPPLAGPARVLLHWAADSDGQALSAANTSSSFSIVFELAMLGGSLLVGSSVVSTSGAVLPPVSGGTVESTDDVSCGTASLLYEVRSLLPAGLDADAVTLTHSPSTPTTMVVGVVVGSSAAVLMCVAAALIRVMRRRQQSKLEKVQVRTAEDLAAGPQTVATMDMELGPTGPLDRDVVAAGGSADADARSAIGRWQSEWPLIFSSLPEGEPKARQTMMDELMLQAARSGRASLDPLAAANSPSGGGENAPRGAPWEAMQGGLNQLIADFQVKALAARPSESPSRARERKELGRGAFGVVILGEWRGLPAAIKLLLLQLDESQTHRERVAREVALTLTLRHPHIVPTYDFQINPVRADNVDALASLEELVMGRAAESSNSSVVAMQACFTMQYCEGGTLAAALRGGMFTAPLGQLTPSGPAGAGAAVAAGVAGNAPATVSPAPDVGVENAPTTATAITWSDVAAAQNLPLALLAACDVLRGLEYLHKCSVVHGDLTEGNILLKAVHPVLPTLPPGRTAGDAPLAHGGSGTTVQDAWLAESVSTCVADTCSTSSAKHAADGCQQPVLERAPALAMPALLVSAPTEAIRCFSTNSASAAGASGSTARLTMSMGSANVFSPSFGAMGATAVHSTQTVKSEMQPGASGAAEAAKRLLRHSFKLADFGLAVQMKGPDQTHVSNMAHGTPCFIAPEVFATGRMSTAADCYSFGVLFWLLLHGVALAVIRPLVRGHAFVPIAPELLRHMSPALPSGAHDILRACLQFQPDARPTASELRKRVEELLREVAGPELSWMLLTAQRIEVTTGL